MDEKNKELISEISKYKNLVRKKANQLRKIQPKDKKCGYVLKKCAFYNSQKREWDVYFETPYPECIDYDTVLRMVNLDISNGVIELFKMDPADIVVINNISLKWKNNSPFWILKFRSNVCLSVVCKDKDWKANCMPAEADINNDVLEKDLKELKHGNFVLYMFIKNRPEKPWVQSPLIEKKKYGRDSGKWENVVKSQIPSETPLEEAKVRFLYELGVDLMYKLNMNSEDFNSLMKDKKHNQLLPQVNEKGVWYFRFHTIHELKGTRLLPETMITSTSSD